MTCWWVDETTPVGVVREGTGCELWLVSSPGNDTHRDEDRTRGPKTGIARLGELLQKVMTQISSYLGSLMSM